MSDKAKLTLRTAWAEFPEECDAVHTWEDNDSGHERWAFAELHIGALQWLFERNMWMPAVPVHPDHRDPLRWLLLEVREWRNEHQED